MSYLGIRDTVGGIPDTVLLEIGWVAGNRKSSCSQRGRASCTLSARTLVSASCADATITRFACDSGTRSRFESLVSEG